MVRNSAIVFGIWTHCSLKNMGCVVNGMVKMRLNQPPTSIVNSRISLRKCMVIRVNIIIKYSEIYSVA